MYGSVKQERVRLHKISMYYYIDRNVKHSFQTFFYVLPFSDVQQTNSAAGFDPIRTNEHDCSGSGLLNLSIGHCHSLMASPWKQPESDIPEEGFGFGLEGGDGDPVIVKSVLSGNRE